MKGFFYRFSINNLLIYFPKYSKLVNLNTNNEERYIETKKKLN